MPKFMDLTGQRYGRMTILYRDTSRKGATFWMCQCECGKVKSVRAGDLRSGAIVSCGCSKGKRSNFDLTGDRSGMLTVVGMDTRTGRNGEHYWVCRCDCGNTTSVRTGDLRSGNTKSCGCRERMQHGGSYSRLYGVWESMKRRCNNPNCDHYDSYGGRGIQVCKEWNESFDAFRQWADANGYNPDAPHGQCTLDRIDNNGNYEPSNCRWVDMKTQAGNRRLPRCQATRATRTTKGA